MSTVPLPAVPDAAAFRALARSSPWRWRTLRFVRRDTWPRTVDRRDMHVRAWLRRPDRLRVEHAETGELLSVSHDGPQGGSWLTTGGGRPRVPVPAEDVTPAYRPDGLVARRPWRVDTDVPMYRNYQWVAMLDPVELADDDVAGPPGTPLRPGTHLEDLAASEHHGRPVWDAIVTPRADYEPRCSCCPLLLHTATDIPPPPEVELATAHHVRLDVETGVCVHVRQIGGTHDGWCLDVGIEAVDHDMPDELFPRRRWWQG